MSERAATVLDDNAVSSRRSSPDGSRHMCLSVSMAASSSLRTGSGFTRRAEYRAAAQMDARNVVNRERPGSRHVAPYQPLEAVLNAKNLKPLIDRFDCR